MTRAKVSGSPLPKSKPPTKQKKIPLHPSKPLKDAKRENFCRLVANGLKVKDAYIQAEYTGSDAARWQLRNHPEIDARIAWMLKCRVDADTARLSRPEKKEGDLRLRVLERLERIAFGDVRQVAAWDKRAKLSADGDVIGIVDELNIAPSHKLSHDAAASIKGVFMKSGELRVELHDPQPALEKLCKALGIYADAVPAPVGPSIAINIAGQDALDAVRRVAFLFAAAEANRPAPLTIEGKAE